MRAVLVGVSTAVLVAALGGGAVGRQDAPKIDGKLLVGKWWHKEVKDRATITEYTKDGKMLVVGVGEYKDIKGEGTYELKEKFIFSTLKLKGFDFGAGGLHVIDSLTKTELIITDLSPGSGGKTHVLVRVEAKDEKKN